MKKPHILYRFYDADDNLLYVGITNSPQTRFRNHSDKYWFKHVIRSTMQHFTTRTELETAEVVAIQTEKPKYNKMHSVAPPPLTVGVSTRINHLSSRDANRFPKPDRIALDAPTREDTEARLDQLQQTLDRRPELIPRTPCPSCDLICLTREHDGIIKCINCLGMWLTEEMETAK